VYVPTLAAELLKRGSPVNFVGIGIGDGCTPPASCPVGGGGWPVFWLDFLHGHAAMSELTYQKVVGICGAQLAQSTQSQACKAALTEAYNEAGGFYEYGYYDDCDHSGEPFAETWEDLHKPRYHGPPRVRSPAEQSAMRRRRESGAATTDDADALAFGVYPGGKGSGGSSCGGIDALGIYLNATAVKQALHVPSDAFFFNADNGADFHYKETAADVVSIYKSLLDAKLQIQVYNGDTDPSINYLVTQNWTAALGLPVKESWRPWTLDGKKRVGGYVTRYEGGLDFVTIKGSGHMVPQFKPPAASVMIGSLLKGLTELPRYSKTDA